MVMEAVRGQKHYSELTLLHSNSMFSSYDSAISGILEPRPNCCMNLERSIWNKPMFATRMKRPCHPPVKYDNCAKLQKKSQNSFALKKKSYSFCWSFLILSINYWKPHSEIRKGFKFQICTHVGMQEGKSTQFPYHIYEHKFLSIRSITWFF